MEQRTLEAERRVLQERECAVQIRERAVAERERVVRERERADSEYERNCQSQELIEGTRADLAQLNAAVDELRRRLDERDAADAAATQSD